MSDRARHLPTAAELLLVRAACLPPSAAREAWSAWLKGHAIASADRAAHDLMPAIFRNLDTAFEADSNGADFEGRALLAGIYRKVWVQNQLRLRRLREVLADFNGAGIETILLKGAALVTDVYRDPGVRPMSDVDILVPAQQAAQAASRLMATGWRPLETVGANVAPALHYTHSTEYLSPDNTILDLHWHLLPDRCDPADEEPFWRGSVAIDFQGEPTRRPPPTDQLLHVIVHGARWRPVRSLTWLLDAWKIIDLAGPALEWDRLERDAAEMGVVLPLRDGLACLSQAGAAIPDSLLGRLDALPVEWTARVDYRLQQGDVSLPATIGRDLFRYVRMSRRRPAGERLSGGWKFLEATWGIDGLAALPRWAATKFRRRLRGVLIPA